MNVIPETDLMGPDEAATYAKLSRSMIYKLCDERRLTHIRVGAKGKRGKILIRLRDLVLFLEENRIDAT